MKKFIVLLLCFALILPLAPQTIAEPLLPEDTALSTADVTVNTENTAAQKTEVLSKRDAYSKTYVLPDGSYQYVGYAEPIHYKDSTGSYVEINNAITDSVKRDDYKYTNTANLWNAYFSEKLNNGDAVMLTSGKYNVSFSLAEQPCTTAVVKATDISNTKSALSAYHQKLSADNRAVIYRDVAENVDIAYTVQTGALKEDIILKSKDTPSVYRFRLTANGLTIQQVDDTISLCTATGEEVFSFAPLFMEDANGKRSEKVSLTYTSVKNGYELTVSADTTFLNAKNTVYPVVIDPSIMVTGSSNTYDTCVDQQYPSSNYYLSESLWTGGALGTNAMRTYLKFNFPTDFTPNQVTYAYIYLLKKDYQTPTIKAYPVTSDWSSSSVTWNNKPDYDSTIYTPEVYNSTGNWYRLNVTNILKCWLNNAFPNYGLVLKEPNENLSAQKTKFYSSDAPSPNKPELVIGYSVGKTLSDVATIYSIEEHTCIPTAITNLAAYWSKNGYPQFNCSTPNTQETTARNVQSAMAAAGSHSANAYIQDGFDIFTHTAGNVTYGLCATNYWQDVEGFTYNDIITEIDAGRPLLLGFRGGPQSPFGTGHMTVCAGYIYSDTYQRVIVSDGWSSKLQPYEFSTEIYHDFIAKVEIVTK